MMPACLSGAQADGGGTSAANLAPKQDSGPIAKIHNILFCWYSRIPVVAAHCWLHTSPALQPSSYAQPEKGQF